MQLFKKFQILDFLQIRNPFQSSDFNLMLSSTTDIGQTFILKN